MAPIVLKVVTNATVTFVLVGWVVVRLFWIITNAPRHQKVNIVTFWTKNGGFQVPENNKDYVKCREEADSELSKTLEVAEQMIKEAEQIKNDANELYQQSVYNCPCQATV